MTRRVPHAPGALVPFALVLTIASALAPAAGAAALDGKQIFIDQKCNLCHSVSSAGVTPTSKMKATDLAGVASKEDPAWLSKFLKKDADKNGKKHVKAFTGTADELSAVVAWLHAQAKPADGK